MPNWCENDLIISGAPDDVEEFVEFAKGNEAWDDEARKSPLDANKFVPYPKEYASVGGYGVFNYNWCINNWGSKWNFIRVEITDDYVDSGIREIIYAFDSAWSPMTPVILAMGKAFPKLKFNLEYYEGRGGFRGWFNVKNGQITRDHITHYNGMRGG